MHEMALAEGILGVVLDLAEGQTARTVRLRVGELHRVLPDSMQFCFQLAAQETDAAEARLEIVDVPARVACHACGAQTGDQGMPLQCRGCGSFDVEVIAGDELLVDAIELTDGWHYRPETAADLVAAPAAVSAEHLQEHLRAAPQAPVGGGGSAGGPGACA